MSNLFTSVSAEQQEIVAGGRRDRVGDINVGNLQLAFNISTQNPTAVVVGSGRAEAIARSRQSNDIRNTTRIMGN